LFLLCEAFVSSIKLVSSWLLSDVICRKIEKNKNLVLFVFGFAQLFILQSKMGCENGPERIFFYFLLSKKWRTPNSNV
jgi:hypothetical protein